MAAKTTTKSDPTFSAAIARVQPALTAWRQRRKHREPIPEALWRKMVRLARRYGLSRVAQVLRVNYTGLKHHLVASSARQAPRTDADWLRQRLGISLQETNLSDKLTVEETLRLFRSFYANGPDVQSLLELVSLT